MIIARLRTRKKKGGIRQKKKLYREIGKIEYESCIVTVGTLILLILLCCVSCMIIYYDEMMQKRSKCVYYYIVLSLCHPRRAC